MPEPRARAFAPHCDQAVLHSPGSCEHCDHYPDWQEYRATARIAFSDELPVPEGKAPCPSTYFRSPEVRDRWGGNVAKPAVSDPIEEAASAWASAVTDELAAPLDIHIESDGGQRLTEQLREAFRQGAAEARRHG